MGNSYPSEISYSTVNSYPMTAQNVASTENIAWTRNDDNDRPGQPMFEPDKRPSLYQRMPWMTWLRRSGWTIEFIGLIISIGCVVAMIVLLTRANNQPVASWTFRFTLNSTIAALSTVFRASSLLVVAACLSQMKWLHFKRSPKLMHDMDLIDSASRGPLGAVMMLMHWTGILGTIGAITILLSLGTGIFAQQMVAQDMRRVVLAVDRANTSSVNDATFPVSLHYDGGTVSFAAHGGLFTPKSSTADVKMEGAIYNGIFNISTPSAYTCSSSCVWGQQAMDATGGSTHELAGSDDPIDEEPYVTLGFASNCTDVTDTARITNQTTHGFTVMTPYNISLVALYSETAYQLIIQIKAVDLLDVVGPDLARFGILRTPIMKPESFVIDTDAFEAYECVVSLAAHTYANVSADGTSFVTGTHTVSPIVVYNNGSQSANNPNYFGDYIIRFNSTDASLNLPIMSARSPDMGAISEFFVSERFSGTLYDGEGVPNPPLGVSAALVNGSITESFASMAESMTTQLRRSNNSTLIRGSTVALLPYVVVRWYYLAFFAILLGFTIILLIGTMIWNSRSHVRLWKDSSVALLCHDVVESQADYSRNFNSQSLDTPENHGFYTIRTSHKNVEELEGVAESMRVKLE